MLKCSLKEPTAHLWTQILPLDPDAVTNENKSNKYWNEIFFLSINMINHQNEIKKASNGRKLVF